MSDTHEMETVADATVKHIGPRLRSKTITLEWPVEYGGKTYSDVVVRRMTTAEVSNFVDLLEANNGSTKIFRFPMFYHPDGARVPDELIDQLDDDDSAALVEAAADFLPRRFAIREPELGTTQASGENTADTSGE